MSSGGQLAGHALVEKERELNELFAGKTVVPQRLPSTFIEIGALAAAAAVREAHLAAHPAQIEILTLGQNERSADTALQPGKVLTINIEVV